MMATPKDTKSANALTKVAIACQGGGSQTAFTAGVLKALVHAGAGKRFQKLR